MKTTLTSLAVVIALTCGIANQAQAGDRVMLQMLCYIEGLLAPKQYAYDPGVDLMLQYQGAGNVGFYVSRIYSPISGWSEVTYPSTNGARGTQNWEVEAEVDAEFPCLVQTRYVPVTHNFGIEQSVFFYFRAVGNANGDFSHVIAWGGDNHYGTATNPPANAIELGWSNSDWLYPGLGDTRLSMGYQNMGTYTPEGGGGGGTDLTPVLDAVAAVEAKLDNLPAGPQGPQGMAGADGQPGGQGAQGKIGPAGAAGAAGATGADAPCVACQDVANSAVNLACVILNETSPTSIPEIENAATTIVETLMISANICEAECDIASGINTAINDKINQ
jgi:hypothetical protein